MFNKITENDLLDKGVVGLPDTPGLTTQEMQRKFDEVAKEVIVPKFNELVESLNNNGASSIGTSDPTTSTETDLQTAMNNMKSYTDTKVSEERQTASDELTQHTDRTDNPHSVTAEQAGAYTKEATDSLLSGKVDKVDGKALSTNDYDNTEKQSVADNTLARHTHENKSLLDSLTDSVISVVNRVSTMFASITGVVTSIVDDDTKLPTSGAIVDYVTSLGGGDMMKATYDSNNDGIVDGADDSAKLGGVLASEYATKTITGDLTQLQTTAKDNLVNAVNEAYNKQPDVLATKEEVEANTEAGKIADALVVKGLSADVAQISSSNQQLVTAVNGLSFAQDSEGNWGYKPSGADTVIPFSSKKLLCTKTFIRNIDINISELCNYYNQLTIDNFLLVITKMIFNNTPVSNNDVFWCDATPQGNQNSYDSSTGILHIKDYTLGIRSGPFRVNTQFTIDVYLVNN